jgi:hypothetical protein
MRSRYSATSRLCLVVALAGAAFVAHGGTPLYKWVDAKGVTHYSDVPEPGATSVEVEGAQGYSAPAVAGARSQGSRGAAATSATAYKMLAISSPEEGGVVWRSDGFVGVSAALEPGLASGHHLWFVVDGTRQSEPADALSTRVELPRGTHTVSAVVTDANGAELLGSSPVTFNVRQNSAVTPPQGPALPKKPHG